MTSAEKKVKFELDNMAVVLGRKDVEPITIEEALETVRQIIVDVAKKNHTMIDYYIHPGKVPSEIEAYRPRLEILHARVQSLSELDLDKLGSLVDQATALACAFLLPIIDQLLSAIHGFQQVFINRYDEKLARRRPYDNAYNALTYTERQLEQFQKEQRSRGQRKLAESMTPIPQRNDEPRFCRFAIAFTNDRDQGRLSQVLQEDLTKDDRERLREHGGAFLSWDCPGCAFRLKYHVVSSVSASILSTDDVRSHSSASQIQYRPSWLVKCHLYQSPSKDRRGSTRADDKTPSTSRGRRGSLAATRRQSEIVSPRSSGSFWFGTPRRSKSVVSKEKSSTSQNRESTTTAKYGCPFCFVVGKEAGHMEYRNGRELAEHMAGKHHVKRAPSGLMLEKYRVGIDGKCAENVRKWEVNIRSR